MDEDVVGLHLAAADAAISRAMRAEARLAEAVTLLRKIEWVDHTEAFYNDRCPACNGSAEYTTHEPDCPLAKILSENPE